MIDITIGGNSFNSNGTNDAFLAKFEPGIGFNWSQQIGGEGLDEVMDLYCTMNDQFIISVENCGLIRAIASLSGLLMNGMMMLETGFALTEMKTGNSMRMA